MYKILNSGVDNQIVENRIGDNQIIVEQEGNGEYAENPRINIKAPTVIEIKIGIERVKKRESSRS